MRAGLPLEGRFQHQGLRRNGHDVSRQSSVSDRLERREEGLPNCLHDTPSSPMAMAQNAGGQSLGKAEMVSAVRGGSLKAGVIPVVMGSSLTKDSALSRGDDGATQRVSL